MRNFAADLDARGFRAIGMVQAGQCANASLSAVLLKLAAAARREGAFARMAAFAGAPHMVRPVKLLVGKGSS